MVSRTAHTTRRRRREQEKATDSVCVCECMCLKWCGSTCNSVSRDMLSFSDFRRMLLLVGIVASLHCPDRLIWNDMQYLEGFGSGFQLRVCCNVTSVQLRQVDPTRRWTLVDDRSTITHRFVDREYANSNDDFEYRQLSICSDKSEPTIGYVQSHSSIVNCTYPQLQLFTVRSHTQLITFNQWYIVCYKTIDRCEYCHFEVICDNEYSDACSDVSMRSSVTTITNTSMNVSIRIGRLMQFVDSSELRITITDNHDDDRRLVIAPQSNATMHVNIDQLRSSHAYTIRVCLHISAPRHFLDTYRLADIESNRRPICQQSMYRTQRAYQCAIPNMNVILLSLFIVISIMR